MYVTIFLKRRFCILIVGWLLLLFILSHVMYKNVDVFTNVTELYKRSGLILDTPGCKIPKYDPFDPSLTHLIKIRKPYICKGDPVFIITHPNSTLVLNDTILKAHYKVFPGNVSCFYNAIYRDMEHDGKLEENYIKYGDSKVLSFGVPLGEDFLFIKCKINKKKFTQYLPLVPIKPKVEKKASVAKKNFNNELNVILIGIDSVSKLNFLRHFKKTHNFLTSRMSALDMKGYTKVGDNTFPNLVPLLTGYFIEHYWNESLRKAMFFDHLDFIWKEYSRKGYRTFYAEDSPLFGTFNYLKRGFKIPPTDYYYRPLALAIDESKLRKRGGGYCLNNQLEVEHIYGYLKDFVKTMGERPYFAFAMVSTLSHDNLNSAGYYDEPTNNLLEELWMNGIMNRSIVVVFSDHGIRFGAIRQTYIGKFEERMPFMYISLPEDFLKKNPIIAKNLKQNQDRLITLFDIHETLHHLLNIKKASTDKRKSTKGQSLFGEISQYRTCERANILPHWCPCQVYQYIPTNDIMAVKLATALVRHINMQLKPFEKVCSELTIDEITDARVGQANDKVLRFVEHKNDVINRRVVYGEKVRALPDYLITLRTSPGGGMFEGTVRHSVKNGSLQVLGISRINRYSKQAKCIESHILEKFCFCK